MSTEAEQKLSSIITRMNNLKLANLDLVSFLDYYCYHSFF